MSDEGLLTCSRLVRDELVTLKEAAPDARVRTMSITLCSGDEVTLMMQYDSDHCLVDGNFALVQVQLME
jgi:hypothetical protein